MGEWVNRFQRRLLPHTNARTIQEIPETSCPGSDLPVQGSAFRFGYSTLGVHSGSKRGETDGLTQGYKDPPVPLDDWLVRATSHQTCLQHTKILVQICQDLGWLVNLEKSELEPKQVRPPVGSGPTNTRTLAKPPTKKLGLLSRPTCPVWDLMSLIGLLTATEKQVHLGRLHMRPIQWHLKNNWRVPESLEKVIPVPRSLHPHLQWWLAEKNVLTG